MIKSVALIGGGGFIGINLANFFIKRNYKILVIGRSEVDKKKFVSNDINTMIVDVNHTAKLVEAIEDYENVIWLVNNLLPSVKMDSLVDDIELNINPLIRFLELSSCLNKVKKFVFISSGGTVYGDSLGNNFFTETSYTKPISAYGMSKIISENYIEYITRKASFDSYILRPSNVYGNFQNLLKPQGIIGYAFDSVINNRTLELFGNGQITRDFIHVFDLAHAIECCILNNYVGAQVEKYNVGSQIGYTVKEIINLVEEVTNTSISTVPMPLRQFDCLYNVLDTTRIQKCLGWKAKININDGLALVWKGIKS